MKLVESGGLALYRSELLDRFPEIGHAFSTRAGGVSAGPFASLNLSSGTGDDRAAVLENRRRLCAAAGADAARLSIPRQVLGSRVVRLAESETGGATREEADALVTDLPRVPTLTLSADCVLILIYDPVRGAIASVHSSRHGARDEISAKAIERLGSEFGSYPSDLVAAIGPSVGPCCYDIRAEVIDDWRRRHGDEHLISRDGKTILDLWSATRAQLRRAGVLEENIDLAGVCTKCRPEEFYSYRRDGEQTGRFGALLWLRS